MERKRKKVPPNFETANIQSHKRVFAKAFQNKRASSESWVYCFGITAEIATLSTPAMRT